MSLVKKPSPRYHRVGHGSNVDESLFGNGTSEKKKTLNGSSRRIVTGPIDDPHAVIISEDELARLKICSTIKTEEQERLEKEEQQKLKDQRERKARERKLRMIELGELAKKNAKKSDSELEREARENALREMAEEKIVNQSDAVKLLTTLGARAAAFTIRDHQLEEKHQRELAEAEYERRLDMMMELDRIKDLQRRDEEEAAKRYKRHEDRKVITEQIQERQRAKLMTLEAREQENIAMRAMKQKFDDDDAVAAGRRREAVERSRLEVLKANEDAIRRKKESKLKEREEMDEILRYQAMRDAELARREEEEAERERLKKEAQMKMLANQERAHNNQAEIDELRARRAAEEKERRYRQAEREAGERRRNDIKELQRARAKQAEDRRRREESEKSLESLEYDSAMQYTQKMVSRENAEREAKEEASSHHREMLQKQIEENDLRKKLERSSKFDEGADSRKKFINDQARLEAIREKMVQELEAEGVNPRYLTEMKNVDIRKVLNR